MNVTSWLQLNCWPSDIRSISICSNGSELLPRLAAEASWNTLSLKPVVKCPPSNRSPQTDSAVSKAWPEADCDGGKRTVLFSARHRSNSCTAGRGEPCKSSSINPRFSCRTTNSVNGSGPDFGSLASLSKRRSKRRSLSPPQTSQSGCCRAELLIATPSFSQPESFSACATGKSNWAAPNSFSFTSASPCSINTRSEEHTSELQSLRHLV